MNRNLTEPRMLPRTLNLGCGLKPRQNCLNVDMSAQVNPDLVWDLNQYPYPLPQSHFDQIYVHDVIEHLNHIPAFLRQMHKLLVPAGLLEITTPHFSCANSYIDPTHRYHLSYFSFDYFVDGHELGYYTDIRFKILHRHIGFHNSFANRFVRKLANRFPHRYEQRFAWIFPAWFLEFRLRAVK